MTKLHILVLIGALVAVSYGQNNVEAPPPEPHPKPTTSVPPTTSPPTQPPTTSKSTPAPTTSKSTSAPTTSKSTPAPTTTPAPTHAPTAPPKPTPRPTPAPEPKPDEPTTGTWQVNDTKTNTSCLLLQFALQIQIPYIPSPNKTYHGFVDIPSNATATGVCGNDTQSIILEWTEDQNITDKIILNFTRNPTTKKYGLTDIEVTITPDAKHFPDFNGTGVLNLQHKYDEFRTSLSKSYKCAKKQELNLTDDANTRRGFIYVSHLQFEAFANSTNKQFSSAEDCAPDTPDVVPIAVGCALAALVIVVLVAYLIGRRRRQARGYLSM